jgi:7-cyano-7-deazaguanine synthase
MDSATLMYKLIEDGYELHALTFDYGQRHEVEIECAKRLTEFHMIPWKLVDLKVLGDVAPSSQTRRDIDVPHGRYDEENMKLTVVPNRNMVMLSLAVAYAIGEKIPEVFYGAHAGDHTIYPDCRVEFIEKLNAAVNIADWFRVEGLDQQ